MMLCDEFYMRRALELAKCAWGDTAPNPMVGAVLVRDGKIIGEGWHKRDGGAHAEIECLRSARENPEGATLYVTLEPCSTRGRTGACSDAIIATKIAKVKIGTLDPNPAHAGRALQIFKDSSVDCEYGILEKECADLNFIFNKSITTQRAVLVLKCALSADGKIAEERGKPTEITGAEARADLARWRKLFSSIGVGKGTLLADNPRLTIRQKTPEGERIDCRTRLLFDTDLSVAQMCLEKFHLFSDEFASKTMVVCSVDAPESNAKKIKERGAHILRLEESRTNPESYWNELKRRLFQLRISSLMLEGGAQMYASLNAGRAADFVLEYRSPKVFGRGLDAFAESRAFDLDEISRARLGVDELTFARVIYK